MNGSVIEAIGTGALNEPPVDSPGQLVLRAGRSITLEGELTDIGRRDSNLNPENSARGVIDIEAGDTFRLRPGTSISVAVSGNASRGGQVTISADRSSWRSAPLLRLTRLVGLFKEGSLLLMQT